MATGYSANDFVPDDYISRDSATGPHKDISYPFTISIWAKPDTVTGTVNRKSIYIADKANAEEYGYTIFNGNHELITKSTIGTQFLVVGSATANAWVHLIASYRGQTDREGYLNGVSGASSTTDRGALSNATLDATTIGDGFPGDADGFDGKLCYGQVHNVNLGTNAYGDLMYNPFQAANGRLWFQTVLVNSATASNYKDLSGKGYDCNAIAQPNGYASDGPPVYHWGAV